MVYVKKCKAVITASSQNGSVDFALQSIGWRFESRPGNFCFFFVFFYNAHFAPMLMQFNYLRSNKDGFDIYVQRKVKKANEKG